MAARLSALGKLSRFATSASWPLRTIGAALSRRRMLAELSTLDDRMLRDIGISRHDVASAMDEPFLRDSTLSLVKRAGESRNQGRVSLSGGSFASQMTVRAGRG